MDISSMLEVQVKEMKVELDVRENNAEVVARTCDFRASECNPIAPNSNLPTYNTDNFSVMSGRSANTTSTPISQEESSFYKLLYKDIASVRFYRVHCTACNVHIGSAPAQINNMFEHPVLRTLLCASCHEFYGDGTFEQGDDATDMFCRWCANGGNLYCCSYCSNTFCYKCIRRNFSSLVRKKIEEDEKWKCFVCNPRDLYSARALCWALLQHVETVTRILKNDKKMSTKEIEEKMNLDESQCCMRKNKRKYRQAESNSEGEDETYIPDTDEIPIKVNRKIRKFRSTRSNSNGIQREPTSKPPLPIRPRPALSMNIQTFRQTDLSHSGTEHKNQGAAPEKIVLPPSNRINTNTSTVLRHSDSGVLQQSAFYRTFMNAGSSTFVQVSPVKSHQITLPSLSSQPISYQPSQLSQSQPQQQQLQSQLQLQHHSQHQPQHQPQFQLQSQPQLQLQSQPYSHMQPQLQLQSQSLPQPLPPSNTMVSIPRKRGRPRLLLPKKKSTLTLTPNIIELGDSDDEPKMVEQQNDSILDMDVTNACSDKIVPVALTWENSDDDEVREEQPLKEMSPSVEKTAATFSEIMLPHKKDLDKLLRDVKGKLSFLFNPSTAVQDVSTQDELEQQKVELFYKCMHNTVLQLVHINDRVVRDYGEWTKFRETNSSMNAPSSVDKTASVIPEIPVEIPSLDMTCVNDSDSDADCEESEYQTKEPSDLVKNNNIIKELLFFFKKCTMHRGVGDISVTSCADKAVQVHNVAPCDYEKRIGHSVLNKANCSNTIDDDDINDTSNPIMEPQKNFGNKYEEQFIYYLQHIEDNGIDTEDADELMQSVDESPSQDLGNTTSSVSSLQDVDPCISRNEQTQNSEPKRNAENCINSLSKNNEIDTPTNAIDKMKSTNKSNIDVKIAEKILQENGNYITKKDAISIISNSNDESSSQTCNNSILSRQLDQSPKPDLIA